MMSADKLVLLRPIFFLLCCHGALGLAPDPQISGAERVVVKGGKIRAWDALYRVDYDIALAVGLVFIVILLWLRAIYLHFTVRSKPDTYKPKYH